MSSPPAFLSSSRDLRSIEGRIGIGIGLRLLPRPDSRFRRGPTISTFLPAPLNVVDTYGGWAPHGGGAFSGKDPTKVDRSAGYMARCVAKNVVAAGLADECLVQLAYCIGEVDPVSVMVTTGGTGTLSDDALSKMVRQVFPLSPRGMIEHLGLAEPIYLKTAAYGHFGRTDVDLTWEHTDLADELLAKLMKA